MSSTSANPIGPGTHTIGFIGLGIMGLSMARHLMDAGFRVLAYTRTKSKAESLLSAGAEWRDSAEAIAGEADVVITIVGYPKDVEEVYFGGAAGGTGVLDSLSSGGMVIDMTTSSPSLAQKIAAAAASKGLGAIDAPVSGGDVGARNGTLSIMCGGTQADFDRAKPLFEIMGKTVALLGGPGAGQHTKMVNQTVIASTVLGVAEALGYARKAGLDLDKVLEVIGGGAAGGFQLNALGPKMAAGDFDPGFYVHHFIKDMSIVQQEADAMGADTPGLDLAKSRFETLAERPGGAEMGTHGIFTLYDKD